MREIKLNWRFGQINLSCVTFEIWVNIINLYSSMFGNFEQKKCGFHKRALKIFGYSLRHWVVSAAFAIMVYFTDVDMVTNIFIAGKINIELDENDAIKCEDGTVGKDQHLILGMSCVKNPTVTVEADREVSYICMLAV